VQLTEFIEDGLRNSYAKVLKSRQKQRLAF